MTISPLSQRDSRWANIKLGTSVDTTIGSHGCTITCLAMAAGITPEEMNRRMINAGAYADTNLVNWVKLQAAVPWLQFEWRNKTYEGTADNDRVKAAIAKNGFCLVEVDFDGKIGTPRDMHWVLYIGNGQMIDPWTGVQKSTSYYPLAKGFAVINRVGDAPADGNMYRGLDLTNTESMKICVDDHMRIVNGEVVDKKKLDDAQSTIEDRDRTIRDLTKQRDDARTDADTAKKATDEFRSSHNTFVAKLANIFATRQEEAEIIAEAQKAITFEDLAASLQKKIDEERLEYDKNLAALQTKLDDAQRDLDELKKNKPTGTVTTQDVQGFIERIISFIIRKGK